jgi:hypothetical protein
MNNPTSLIPENLPDLPDTMKNPDIMTLLIINVEGDVPLWEGITTLEVDVKGILLGD